MVFPIWSCNEEAEIRSSLFWDISQRRLAVSHRRSHRQRSASPETSVTNYQSTLRNIPEERRSHLHRAIAKNHPRLRWLDVQN